MPHWFDQITDKFVRNVANRYVVDTGIEAFRIFPQVPVRQLSGYIGTYDKDAWIKIGTVNDYKRSGANESIGDDYDLDKTAYTLEEIAFHKDVSKDERLDYDNPFSPIEDAVDFVIGRIKRVLMKNMFDTYLAASVWSTEKDGSTADFTQWQTGSTGTPVDDILSWHEAVQKITGYRPNRILMAPDVYRTLKTNDDITDVMKTTSDKVVTKQLLAKVFEVDTVEIMEAINSDGDDYLFSEKMLMVYTPDNPSKMKPSAGYNLTFRGQNHEDVGTRRIPMPQLNDSLRIEAWMKVDPVVLAADLGVYVTTALA